MFHMTQISYWWQIHIFLWLWLSPELPIHILDVLWPPSWFLFGYLMGHLDIMSPNSLFHLYQVRAQLPPHCFCHHQLHHYSPRCSFPNMRIFDFPLLITTVHHHVLYCQLYLHNTASTAQARIAGSSIELLVWGDPLKAQNSPAASHWI